jgi:anti-sigma regulatory factor (Ser/Thr protein kinase)
MKFPYVVKLELPADVSFLPLLRNALDGVLKQVDVAVLLGENAGKIAGQVKLAVHEVCANVMEHGYGGNEGRIDILIKITEAADTLVIELHDEAKLVFHPNLHNLNGNVDSTRGRGLQLVAGLLDEVSYVSSKGEGWYFANGAWQKLDEETLRLGRENAGNYWRLVKKLHPIPLESHPI